MAREPSPELLEVLREAQRLGHLGDRPVEEVVDHARGFVDALHDVDGTVIDLGAGGGVPGLVIAHDLVDLRVVLVDRRTKRTDFLERVVRRLGWSDRVDVVVADVEDLARREPGHFDAAVARGFGGPRPTLELASRLVRRGGVVLVSEPPDGDRWQEILPANPVPVRREATAGRVARFRIVGP